MIAKTRSVLKLQVIQDQRRCEGISFAFFKPDDGDEGIGSAMPRYDMEIGKWEELGKPEVITITTEAGDLLNDKKDDDERRSV